MRSLRSSHMDHGLADGRDIWETPLEMLGPNRSAADAISFHSACARARTLIFPWTNGV
jgi:hypothetical protein